MITLQHTRDVKVSYMVKVRCHEVRDNGDGSVMTPEDAEVFLGWPNEGGGWPTCYREGSPAPHHPFKSPEEAIAQWHRWDGCVWYYRFKPETMRIIKVTEIVERKEEEEMRLETIELRDPGKIESTGTYTQKVLSSFMVLGD